MPTIDIRKLLKDPSLFKEEAFINNQWVKSSTGASFPINNPATGEIIAQVANLGAADAEKAIAAADQALTKWKAITGKERAGFMRKWFDLILQNKDDLAVLMTLEQGKPLTESAGEVVYGASFIEWYAEEAKRVSGTIPTTIWGDKRFMVLKQPVGVCVAITPWNFPNAMITRKIAPAMAAGCTIVIKPAEQTPLSALALAELAVRAGIPEGVVNIVTADADQSIAVGKALCASPTVRHLSFTGSTEVGHILMAQCAPTVKKLGLELGGHAPFIVFDDADIDRAASMLAKFKIRNAGQVCVSPTRFYVQKKAYDKFLAKFIDVLKTIKVGNGLDDGVEMGPLAHERRVPAISRFVEDARKRGAKVELGGDPSEGKGFFFPPTVITGLKDDSMLMTEEPFGPIAPVVPFDDTDEVIRRSNSLPFGLSSYVFTNSLQTATKVSNALEAGMVNINHFGSALPETPFGGIKDSGIGSEGGSETFDGYLVTKFVTHI